jgi:hypothetical protein
VIVGGSNDEMRESVSGTKELLTLGAGMSARAALCVLALRARDQPPKWPKLRLQAVGGPIASFAADCVVLLIQLLTGIPADPTLNFATFFERALAAISASEK